MDESEYLEIDVPLFIELKQSLNQNNDLGAFSKTLIGDDQFIGNFKGKLKSSMSSCDMNYTWAILSSRDIPVYYIDASDPKDSNWLRFIRSTSDPVKANIICLQQNQQINYFTSKEIKQGQELLTYVSKRKKIQNTKSSKSLEKYKTYQESIVPPPVTRSWTCQTCKKRFEQRNDLSKHQCNEQNLRLLKKKKEIRKKRWRDMHWKRRMDLSYIETTTLNKLTTTIADNLSFCVDGTNEDLFAFSREVKDYLNTDLGTETQIQMFLRCCFADVYKKLGSAPSALLNIDVNLISKANAYFVDSIYVPTKNFDQKNSKLSFSTTSASTTSSTSGGGRTLIFNCKNCRYKFNSMSELIYHQRQIHDLNFKTTFDHFNTNNTYYDNNDENNESFMYCSNSPIGYFECDPFSFVFNLHWDQTLQVCCRKCDEKFPRNKVSKHFLTCENDNKKIENNIIDYNNNNNSSSRSSSSNSIQLDCQKLINDLIQSIENNNQETNDSFIHESEKMETDEHSEHSNDSIFANHNYNFNNTNLVRKYNCEKCGLEFTSPNSVNRHKEKSCLRVKVNDRKCPICSSTFSNTHRLSIHIYKHHRSLLGPASDPPVAI